MRLLAAIAVLVAAPAYADVDIFAALEQYADSQPARPAAPKRTIFTTPAPAAPKPAARQLITSPRWLQDGHSVTVSHLITTHGFTRQQLAGLTQRQLDDLHSDAHNRAAKVTRTVTRSPSPCPGGVCPTTRRGIFFRR